MAQYSDTQEVLFKSDVLLSAVSHLSLSYQPLFLGLQTILDHKFPATLVPTAIINKQLLELSNQAAQHKLTLLFSDPSYVSQAETQFFTTKTQVKILINIPLLSPSHNKQYEVISIPKTFIKIKNSVWLFHCPDLTIRDANSHKILTSTEPETTRSCPVFRSIRVCRRPTIHPRESCTTHLLSNNPNTSSCLPYLSIPSDPHEFIVNNTLHHFSTIPTPYTLHCPTSSHASTLSGLSALKIPPHCQFKSPTLLHDNHPAITQAFDIPSKDLLIKPDFTENILSHLDLPQPHQQLEEFWNNTMIKIQALSQENNSLPKIQELINANSIWSKASRFFSRYSAFFPLPVLLVIIVLAFCLCIRSRRTSANLGQTLSQLSANTAAAQQLANFR